MDVEFEAIPERISTYFLNSFSSFRLILALDENEMVKEMEVMAMEMGMVKRCARNNEIMQ